MAGTQLEMNLSRLRWWLGAYLDVVCLHIHADMNLYCSIFHIE
jgi:hypothetical protein